MPPLNSDSAEAKNSSSNASSILRVTEAVVVCLHDFDGTSMACYPLVFCRVYELSMVQYYILIAVMSGAFANNFVELFLEPCRERYRILQMT